MNKWDQVKQDRPKEKLRPVKRKSAKLQKQRKKESDKLIKKHQFTKNQTKFLDALRQNLGIISKAAHASGLHRNNHFAWIKKSKEYELEYNDILDECIDYAENALLDQIGNSDTTAIIFYLKCKGKKRGYIERSELEMSGNIINVIAPSKK